jgi:hypothetical protein
MLIGIDQERFHAGCAEIKPEIHDCASRESASPPAAPFS